MIGFAAHRIDIGDGIGRGDAAEIVGIVDDRHEEIGGGDDAKIIVDLPDRGVVAGFGADQQLAIRCGGRLIGQQVAATRRAKACSRSRRHGQGWTSGQTAHSYDSPGSAAPR